MSNRQQIKHHNDVFSILVQRKTMKRPEIIRHCLLLILLSQISISVISFTTNNPMQRSIITKSQPPPPSAKHSFNEHRRTTSSSYYAHFEEENTDNVDMIPTTNQGQLARCILANSEYAGSFGNIIVTGHWNFNPKSIIGPACST